MFSAHSVRRSLTIMEIAVALAVFSVVIVAAAGFMQIGGDTSSLVHAQTRAQLDAERILRLVRAQLSRSGYPPGGGDLQVQTPHPDPATGNWRVDFNVLQNGTLIDPFNTAPDPYSTIPWSNARFSLRWEHTTDPAIGAGNFGVDNDGDYILDDGQIAIYRIGAPDQLVAVIAEDVRNFVLTEQAGLPRPRIRLQVTVERALINAVKDANDAAALRAGGGPRVSHTADMWVVIPN